MKDAILKDLELQWNDHMHMREQSWKILNYSILMFLGIIALEFKELNNNIMLIAYFSLALVSLMGLFVASHHRVRRGQKFQFIKKYEEELGLYKIKSDIIKRADMEAKRQFSGINISIFTTRFIEVSQLMIFTLSCFLFISHLL